MNFTNEEPSDLGCLWFLIQSKLLMLAASFFPPEKNEQTILMTQKSLDAIGNNV